MGEEIGERLLWGTDPGRGRRELQERILYDIFGRLAEELARFV